MTDEQKTSLLKFPCDFPIKVVGKASDNFEVEVFKIFHQYCPDLPEGSLKQRASNQGKYLALTVTIHAQSQEQLDNIYQALSQCPEVIMAL